MKEEDFPSATEKKRKRQTNKKPLFKHHVTTIGLGSLFPG
jgi:hypothetical protein